MNSARATIAFRWLPILLTDTSADFVVGGYGSDSSPGPGCCAGAVVLAGPVAVRAEAMAWMAWVSSRIWLEMCSSSSFCCSSSWTVCHWWSARTWRFSSARFWLIITKVDRKIASSDTIIVSSPKGYFSTRKPIQAANQMTWIYTNIIDPANRVIASAIRFSRLCLRSSACWSSAGLTGMGSARTLKPSSFWSWSARGGPMAQAMIADVGGRPGLGGAAKPSWPGLFQVAKDGRSEPLACQQGQFNVQAVLIDGTPDGLLGLADSVLDTVFVQDEPFGGGFEAAVLLQEDAEGVAEPGAVVVIVGERPERLDDPSPHELDRTRHERQRSDLAEAGDGLSRWTGRQRDRVRAQRLPMGAAEAGDARARGAEGEPDSGVCPGIAGAHRPNGERVPGAEREPGPGAGLVLGKEDRPALALHPARHLASRVFQPRERAAVRFCLADPADHPEVVLPEPVAQDRLGGIDVDPVIVQQRPDPGRAGRAEVAQPALLLGFVGGHKLFRHSIDVGVGDLGQAHPRCADDRRVVGPPAKFLQAPVLEPGRAKAIGTQQRGHGDPALREPAGVRLSGRGCMHAVQVDAVLEDVQHGGHVLPDAGFQQREDPPVGAQLGDLPHDQVVDIGGQLTGARGKCTGDLRGALCNGWT